MSLGKIDIVGSGPAGLIAAEVAVRYGYDPVIHTLNRQFPTFDGAQYLHTPLPGITSTQPQFEITYVKKGSVEGYANKVYGNADHPCSFAQAPDGNVPAWSLRDVYEQLWYRFATNFAVGHASGMDIMTWARKNPVIIAAPLISLCMMRSLHEFNMAFVSIRKNKEAVLPEDTIIYSGLARDEWYRASNIQGWEYEEYGHEIPFGQPVAKPQWNTCKCFEQHPMILQVGRYGRWQRGILSDQTYPDTERFLDAV